MTDEQFSTLISAADELARTDPARYLRKMQCLLWLGDIYLAAIAGSLLALQAGAFFLIIQDMRTPGSAGLQTVVCLPVLMWAVWLTQRLLLLRGKRKPMTGIAITREQAPELFGLIDTLCGQADALPVHHVLITDEFHACVEQLPRLGLFGWHQNRLLLGLPLFKCLTAEQFKVLLAHELGHIASKGWCKMARQGHRQMLRWTGLADTLGDDPHGWLFKHFLEWFIDYVGACAFPLARMSEYEADALSVELVSHEAAVAMLSVSNVIDRYLQEHYWPQVRRLADQQPEPAAPYQMMGETFAAQVTAAWAEHWVRADMRAEVGLTSTHPSLQERLAALQAAPRIVLAGAGKTAEGLLGSALQPVTGQMDRNWQDGIRSWWTDRYERVRKSIRQFAELNARAAQGEKLTVEESYERARLTWSVGRDAEETLRQLLALYFRDRENALASFALGAWLLTQHDDEDQYTSEDGYALLEQAMRLDEGFTAKCCEMLRDYCQEKGREDLAEHWDEKLQARLKLEEAAAKEGGGTTQQAC